MAYNEPGASFRASAEKPMGKQKDHSQTPHRTGRLFSRRSALKAGLAGAAAVSAGGWLASRLLQDTSPLSPASARADGAMAEDLWALWQKRGWAKEARFYEKRGQNIACGLCPNGCILPPEGRGRCRDRINKGGVLYTLAYGNPCAFHVDPVEKKPLYHFLPGSKIFSLATPGCPFRCLNCQNWDISQRSPEDLKDPRGPELRLTPRALNGLRRGDMDRLSMFPDDVVTLAEYLNCPLIAYTYSEPTAFYEYMVDTSRRAHEKKLRNVWVTCGYIREKPLIELCKHIDGANVDLKSFDESIYRKLNSGKLQPVLDTLKTLRKQGVWQEVTNLVVPTYTDKMDMIKRMCGWLADNLGPDTPLHFSRFHPAHKLSNLPPTPVGALTEAREIARRAGLRYVYIGNVRGVSGADTTVCPKCKMPVIERDLFSISSMNLRNGRCKQCGEKIPGVWS
jgi:pyruvate formate lyase activating enzyme